MNIYLDVNGVLLQQDLTPAIGITDFLKRAVKNNDVYWLTSHCKGDSATVLAYLERILPKEAYELTKQIKPTNWDVLKTDGIDFSKDFLWLDDNLFESEKEVLRKHKAIKKHIFVDLKIDPLQLEKLPYTKATNKEIIQVAQLIRVAEWRMTYCETIVSYPTRFKKRDFDTDSLIDSFYKNICVSSFDDAILILGSLLEEEDDRPISLWHLGDFAWKNQVKLRSLKGLYELHGLKQIRDQIVAHHDKNNSVNTYPDARINGYINYPYIEKTQRILLDLIILFLSYMKETATPYDPEYFSNEMARKQIEAVLECAKPKLTNDYIG